LDTAMATSGDYRNYFKQNGAIYSHTLDPRTGRPITHSLASITVLAPTAARADALATAFLTLGLAETLRIAEANQLAVLAIMRGNDLNNDLNNGLTEEMSSKMASYLKDKSG
ncbi:MAG: FAD:protein FMN transferase, partial [Pseudomonadales bacterium]